MTQLPNHKRRYSTLAAAEQGPNFLRVRLGTNRAIQVTCDSMIVVRFAAAASCGQTRTVLATTVAS
jgi:hypothetical protein